MFSLKIAASLLLIHLLHTHANPLPPPTRAIIPRVFVPRDHLECDNNGWNCHQVATCDNDYNDVAGELPPAPSNTPSSAPSIPNPITIPHANATLESDGSVVTSKAKPRSLDLSERQIAGDSTIQWCDLGTTFYVLLNPTSSGTSNNIKSLMSLALTQISNNLPQNANQTVPASTSPILQYEVSSGDRFNVYNYQGVQAGISYSSSFNWEQLFLATNLTNQWMMANGYYQMAIQASNGSYVVGRIEIN